MTSTIIHNATPTGELPITPAAAPRSWVNGRTRPTGRHRTGPTHRVHVSAIDGVNLARRPQRLGAGAKPTPGLLARLLRGSTS